MDFSKELLEKGGFLEKRFPAKPGKALTSLLRHDTK
jgi:hypothetical protein